MAKYRRIDTRIWNDEKFRAWDSFTEDLWLYILTNPQTNQVGLYVYRHEAAMADLLPKWESAASAFRDMAKENGSQVSYEELTGSDNSSLIRAYHRAWQALISGRRIAYHSPSRVLFVCHFLRYEPPASHLNVLGWKDILADLPTGHPFFPQLKRELGLVVDDDKRPKCLEALQVALPKPTGKGMGKGMGKVCLSQEQEQEQEQERDNPLSPPTGEVTKQQTIRFSYETGQFSGTESAAVMWREAYPHIDATQESRKAAAWLMGNRDKPKTRFGKFLVNWLARAEKEAANGPHGTNHSAPQRATSERNLDFSDRKCEGITVGDD